MRLLIIAFLFSSFEIGENDVVDPLSNHNLGTANNANINSSSTNITGNLGACTICRYSTKSFKTVYTFIGKQKVKDGLGHWEGNNLILKDASVDLLSEIKANLCTDLKIGKNECINLYKNHDATINYWWNNKRKDNNDLTRYLCVDILTVCCPDGHYGSICKRCPGGPFNVCSKRGQCRGDGTKNGSGKCVCHKGYSGDLCNQCEPGYYLDKSDQMLVKKSIDDDNNKLSKQGDEQKNKEITCLPCDKSCVFHCRSKGPRGCEVCKSGFFWDNDYGCIDIDECNELKRNPCNENTFCVNTEGSYFCYECDKSCDGCHGDGPDMCLKCAADHRLEGKICVSDKPNHQETQMEMSRYVTYLGLCMATCIIFRNNIYIASVIGCIVASYIGIAEYTIGSISIQKLGEYLMNFLR